MIAMADRDIPADAPMPEEIPSNACSVVPIKRDLSFLLGRRKRSAKSQRDADIVDKALSAAYDLQQGQLDGYIKENLEACESPAEQLFFLGLMVEGLNTKFDIIPQYKVKTAQREYRIDFALFYPCLPDPILPDLYDIGGEELCNALYPTVKIAAEVDGHEFHERTKAQATRDKQRDRDLTADGWVVVRFTGSEIYSDWKRVIDEDAYEVPFASELWILAHKRWIEIVKHRVR